MSRKRFNSGRYRTLVGLLVAGSTLSLGQAMMEAGAAIAGTSSGAMAGKKVSDSLTLVLGKTAKAAEKAAAPAKPVSPAPQPLIQVGTGIPKPETAATTPAKSISTPAPASSSGKTNPAKVATPAVGKHLEATRREVPYNVPAPPPPKNAKPVRVAPRSEPVLTAYAAPVPQPITPLPRVTPGSLSGVVAGTSRRDLLALGLPESRIKMQQDGHLLEIFHYSDHAVNIGTVRLIDGAVEQVMLHP